MRDRRSEHCSLLSVYRENQTSVRGSRSAGDLLGPICCKIRTGQYLVTAYQSSPNGGIVKIARHVGHKKIVIGEVHADCVGCAAVPDSETWGVVI